MVAFLRLLFVEYPDLPSMVDRYDRTLLAMACVRKGSRKVIECLVEQHEAALTMEDADWNLPIHVGCMWGLAVRGNEAGFDAKVVNSCWASVPTP
jgi:hypothetical protein